MTDKKSIISDIAGLSQPLTKLVEAISAGIGTWYEPIGIERKAKAEAKQIQIIAEICTKNINVPVHYDKNGLDIDTNKSVLELVKRTMLRNFAQEMNKQQNIESVINYAKEILEKEKEVSKEPVSSTWLSNFFESAGHVEEEDLQKIWGKLLAGEIKQPNSYSLRTLNILKNMTSNEAKIFQKAISMLCKAGKYYFLPNDNKLLKGYNLSYEELLILVENNLIVIDGSLHTEVTLEYNQKACIVYNNLLACLRCQSNDKEYIPLFIYPLTSNGKELSRLVEIVPQETFFKEYVKTLEQRKTNIKINVYRIKKTEILDGKEIYEYDISYPIY